MNLIYIGGLIAIGLIIFDKYLENKGSEFRTPVLAVAVGIYLPLELSSAIFIGGLVAYAAAKHFDNQIEVAPEGEREKIEERKEDNMGNGILFASGLITGEALVGILMAIPIVIYSDGDIFSLVSNPIALPGIVAVGIVVYFLYKVSRGKNES